MLRNARRPVRFKSLSMLLLLREKHSNLVLECGAADCTPFLKLLVRIASDTHTITKWAFAHASPKAGRCESTLRYTSQHSVLFSDRI
ncbi:hypothetical protein BGX38DRAFT_474713 [Terfezia claveryi]|nr:hypothetical protein BGX38DRAFT_474713 [Terfezia claveryi]